MPACKQGDPAVWLTPRNMYHMKGDVMFGTSPFGKYVCLSEAKTAGAVRGPSSPMGPGGAMGRRGGMGGMGPGGAMGPGAAPVSQAPKPTCKSGDPVVWVTPRNFYFEKNDFRFGKTPIGSYSCLSQAKAHGAAPGPPPGTGRGMPLPAATPRK